MPIGEFQQRQIRCLPIVPPRRGEVRNGSHERRSLLQHEMLIDVAKGQTRTSSLGAARPLPPSADIDPGGQSVGQAAQFCLDPNPSSTRYSGDLCDRRVGFWQILLQKSKIERCRKSRESRFLDTATVAGLLSANAQVRGPNPDFLLGGRTSASAEGRHWSGRAVRWSSCAILLRVIGAAGFQN